QFARPAPALEAEGRAAAGAETATHPRGGVEIGRLTLGEAHPGPREAGIGRDRRAGMPPAARAVAVARPFGRAVHGEADRAAEAASLAHARDRSRSRDRR